MKINALGGNYSVGAGVNTRKLVNCYLERNEEGGDGDNGYIALPTMGIKAIIALPGMVAGEWVDDYYFFENFNPQDIQYVYLVLKTNSATRLARIQSTGGQIVGSIQPTSGGALINAFKVFAGDNLKQLVITNDGLYILNVAANSLAPYVGVAEVDQGVNVIYLNSRWVVQGSDGYLYYSLINDPTFTAIDYFTVRQGTKPVEMCVDNVTDIFILTNEHSEIFIPTDDATEPFVRQINLTGTVGGVARLAGEVNQSLQSIHGVKYWIGANQENQKVVYRASGGQPQRVSNNMIEQYLNQSNAYDQTQKYHKTYFHEHNGHIFYCIPKFNSTITWCYDLNTGLWHERQDPKAIKYVKNQFVVYRTPTSGFGLYHKTDYSVSYFEQNLDEKFAITRIIEAEPLYDANDYHKIYHSEVRVKSSGIYDANGLYSPNITLDISKNGGLDFSITRTASRNIEGFNRFNMLGASNKQVYRYTFNNPAYLPLNGINGKLQVGKS
jgi:hypothetical protein